MKQKKVGIEEFIIKKLEKANKIEDIVTFLRNSGFSEKEIEEGFANVKKHHKTIHQDIVASNSFFPPLNKLNKEIKKDFETESFLHLGLFAGRMRRKDFVVSILFLFSLLFSFIVILTSFVDALYPEKWSAIETVFLGKNFAGAFLIYLPIIFAPFTLMFLSLVTRRLHDLDLPGVLSFFYLTMFVFPFSRYANPGIVFLDIVLVILFIFMLLKRGNQNINRYGKTPPSHGSTFSKILNLR